MFFEDGVPSDILESLAEFATVFFGMPVKLLPEARWKDKVAHRSNPYSGHMQVRCQLYMTKPFKEVNRYAQEGPN